MEMREFKRLSSQRGLPISPSASVLYLWTEAGCLYHCKLINTQSAWQVFGELVRVYFAAKGAPLDAVQVTERKKPADLACVYGMLMSDNNVKIGHTGDIPDRLQRVKRETKLDVLKEHHSDFMPRDDARRIEKTLHRRFAQMRVRGEFFNVDFERVVEAIDSVEINVYEETESVPDYRRVELMIELLHAPLDSPLKEKLFMETANLLLDRNIF